MYRIFTVCLAISISSPMIAQYDHEDVFKELSGTNLFDALQENYTAEQVLSFAKARDTLFATIWGENDSLRCVYTDYPRYMDPNKDPTQTVFNDGQANGINTEHSYPQSKGASSGNPRADMHHLFPSRVDVNGTRASLPFAEIPDNETTSWFYEDIKTNTTPTTGIDNYSEATNSAFEVREAFKGNIARAIFYFYTIYRSQAVIADPDFFAIQKDDLCKWHYEDPVDEKEWNNTYKIASHQDGKVNPFVLDCSLAARLYCPNISSECSLVKVSEIQVEDFVTISPNPVDDFLNISKTHELVIYTMYLMNVDGHILKELEPSSNQIVLNDLNAGIYLLQINSNLGVATYKVSKL